MSLPITMTGLFIYAPQLTTDLDASMAAYALALTGMGIAKLPGALLGGRWADRLGPTLLARTYLLPYALALLLAQLWGSENLGRVRAVLSAAMVFSTGIAPAVLGTLVDAGLDFRVILAGMLAFIVVGWLLAQRPIAEARISG